MTKDIKFERLPHKACSCRLCKEGKQINTKLGWHTYVDLNGALVAPTGVLNATS